MRAINIKKGYVSVIISLLIIICFTQSGVPAFKIEVSAAKGTALPLPSNDLVKIQELEEINTEREVDGFRVRVLNSSYNYNTGVTTGAHYDYLNTTEKAYYRALVVAAQNTYAYGSAPTSYTETGCAKLVSDLDSEFVVDAVEYNNALEAAKYDHIDLLPLTLCEAQLAKRTTTYTATNTTTYEAYIFLRCTQNYNYSQSQFDAMATQLRSARTAFLADPSITGAKGVLGKELAIHDKLIAENTYDNACLKLNTSYHIGHTAYGALVNGTSVCDGYAMAYEYLLEGIDVESMVVSGYITEGGSGGHAWNIVKLNNLWYEVDATWDDQENLEYSSEVNDQACHLFYNLTTNLINKHSYKISLGSNKYLSGSSTRTRSGVSSNLPIAHSNTYNYARVLAYLNSTCSESGIPVSDVGFDTADMPVYTGDEHTLYAYVLPADAEDQKIIWSSSDESKLTIDENGKFTALSSGECTVTATTRDGGYARSKKIIITDRIITVNVSFDMNDGSGYTDSIQAIVGQTYGELPSDIEREGYTFNGWFTDAEAGTEVTAATVVTDSADHTLYAHWTEVEQPQLPSNDNENADPADPDPQDTSANDTTAQEPAEQEPEAEEPRTAVQTVIQKSASDDAAENKPASDNEAESPAVFETATVTSGNNDYLIDASGEATLTKQDNKKIKKVTIADTVEYNGAVFRVTEIGEDAYKNCKKLTSATIGSNIEKIGSGAFSGCEKLKKITIKGDNLKTIGSGSFKNIKKGAKITIICKEKKTYTRLVKKIRKAGAKTAVFKFKKGK